MPLPWDMYVDRGRQRRVAVHLLWSHSSDARTDEHHRTIPLLPGQEGIEEMVCEVALPKPRYSRMPGEVGSRVRRLRQQKAISALDMAASLGVTRAHLEDIETGFEIVDIGMLASIAAVFGHSLSSFMQGL